jgi:hypothetical protein
MSVITNALDRATRAGVANDKSQQSIAWFRRNLRKTTVSPSRLIREAGESESILVNSWRNVGIGKMYNVFYDPKHKKTLPYYDRFPLVIPIHHYRNGILGLNLHYLPPVLRANLLDKLMEVANNPTFDERKKMVISYGILRGAERYKGYKPCLKRYLGNHFRSRFLRIHHNEWVVAAFLPTETFEKANNKKVWSDSRGMI